MPRMTPRGKVYSLDELIRLSTVNTYGEFSQALGQALRHLKHLEAENKELKTRLSELESKSDSDDNNSDS